MLIVLLRHETLDMVQFYDTILSVKAFETGRKIAQMNSPKEIAQNYVTIGITKTQHPIVKMFTLAIMAGLFISLAGVGSMLVPVTVIGTPLASFGRVISAAVFPAGLAMILLAGSELFTGNCLIIISVLEREVKLRAMLKNWFFVYTGNFVGGIIIAAISVFSGTFSLFNDAAAVGVIHNAVTKVNLTFGEVFLRGILCNFLVCIAVWMSNAAKDVVGKLMAMFLPIMLFVLSNYEHSIANMFFLPAGLFALEVDAHALAYIAEYGAAPIGTLTWGSIFVRNLIPSTLGNIFGGMVLVGVVYWFIYLHDPEKRAPAKSSKKKKK
jgi:formate/nitrite transporter